jgi:hypothetical protein
MGANVLAALLSIIAAQSPPPDTTSPYTSPAVQALVERAMARRRAGDSAVSDYRARITYRLTVSLGRRRWARAPVTAAEEQVADVQWQRPNDLRVDVIGRRFRSRSPELQLSSVWDRPWFVPRGVDDSVRIFSDEFPARGALHPLAPSGPRWYSYRLASGLTVTPARGSALRLYEVEVTPRRTGPALIAGRMWIDSASAEVVRLTFRYVGTGLWVLPEGPTRSDSASARRVNSIANRIVSVDADLEYGLIEGRYWMPHHQVISGRVRIPVVSDLVIPFRARTVFEDFAINSGQPIVFEVPLADTSRAARRARRDSLRAERRGGRELEVDSLRSWNFASRWSGGRYELHRPSNDSLKRFTGWRDSLSLRTDPAEERRRREVEEELASLAEALPGPLTGRAEHGFAYERFGDILRYDRVQGLSLGLGYQFRVPGTRFAGVYGTVRYGLSDERVTGRLTLLRDAPDGRLAISGYREIGDVDPFALRRGAGNSLNALFSAHDNGDYYLAHGASASLETALGEALDLSFGARAERQTSTARAATSEVNDFFGGSGFFAGNPPVDEGTFVAGHVRITGLRRTRWWAAADLLVGEGRATGRLYGEVRREVGGARGLTLRVKGGLASRPTLQQSLFRLGGINTVRGFDYGALRGQAFWAAQLDLAPTRGRLRPVAFIDGGQTGRPGDLLGSKALVGGGIGLSVFGGLVRFDLSHPISPETGGKLRFDVVVQAPR